MTDSSDLPTSPILGIPISTFGMQKTLEFIAQRTASKIGGYVCFANVHTVTESISNPALNSALNHALLSVADGLPLVWVSRMKGRPIESRVCGPDFMKSFLEGHRDIRSGFIGGIPGQAERLAANFNLSSSCFSPPMRPFSEKSAEEDWKSFLSINSAKPLPHIIWVGLGAPKQELWMQTVSKFAPNILFFGVGAAFDFLTHTKKRAPIWMQRSGLEWLYRLYQEPRRLWKRYFVTNSRFVMAIAREFLFS